MANERKNIGLKAIVAQKLMSEVIRVGNKKKGWRVLIVDEQALRTLSACCKMHEISSEGITIVDQIDRYRQPLPEMEAIYLLTPTQETIRRLVKDFEKHLQYECVHLFLTEACPDHLFEELCNGLVSKYIKTFIEIYISFRPLERKVFTLDKPSALSTIFSPDKEGLRERELDLMAEQISTLCYTLGELPAIRYRSENKLNQRFAEMVKKKLEFKKRFEPELGEGGEKSKSVLLLLDRGFDPVSPILHELTFQAMVYDLLQVKDDIYSFPSSDNAGKEVLLDEDDHLWTQLRHEHIATVLEGINKKFKNFLQEKNVAKENQTVKDLTRLVKSLPEHQKAISEFGTHMHLAEECMAKYKGYVDKLCKVEQDMAMGTDAAGIRITTDHIHAITPLLLDMTVKKLDKIRLILLCILSRNGISDEHLTRLLEHAQIPLADKKIFTNVAYLGHKVLNDDQTRKPFIQLKRKNRQREDRYDTSRWTPVLKDILEELLDGKLDQKQFPYIGDPKQTSGATSNRLGNWHKEKGSDRFGGKMSPRLIVFIMGGVSYSEMRTVYELNQARTQYELFIGGSHIVTPSQFISDIGHLTAPVFTDQNETAF